MEPHLIVRLIGSSYYAYSSAPDHHNIPLDHLAQDDEYLSFEMGRNTLREIRSSAPQEQLFLQFTKYLSIFVKFSINATYIKYFKEGNRS